MARILIANKNDTMTDFLSKSLKKGGHIITHVDNTLDAWRASSRGEHEVILIDVEMPGIDSFVLAQRARQENPDIAVIFVTGFSGTIMDTEATPAYAPAPITSRNFHLKQVNAHIRYLTGQVTNAPTNSVETSSVGNGDVIHANFKKNMEVKQIEHIGA